MLIESCLIALQGLWANKLRLILTMVGIIVGVGVVIALVSLGISQKARTEEFMDSFGTDIIRVSEHSNDAVQQSKLSLRDRSMIARLPTVRLAVPVNSYQVKFSNGNKNWNNSAIGTLPEYFELHKAKMKYGRFITEMDIVNKNKVVVLGTVPAKILFEKENPVGQLVRIDNVFFRVVGVCILPMEGIIRELGEVAVLPLYTAQECFGMSGDDHLQMLQVQAREIRAVLQTEKAVVELLRAQHHIGPGQKDDFITQNAKELLARSEDDSKRMLLFLGSIAALSLFVGGVGVMNIMLIAVTQRTTEIGIRKALGATYKDILLQFLIEALAISSIGAAIGVAFGAGLTALMDNLMGIPPEISGTAIIVAVITAVAVGLFFGMFPAHRAALLHPVDALRYEG